MTSSEEKRKIAEIKLSHQGVAKILQPFYAEMFVMRRYAQLKQIFKFLQERLHRRRYPVVGALRLLLGR